MSRSVNGNIDRLAPQHSGSTAYINARIIDPTGDAEYQGAVLISDGKIADYGPNLFASGAPYGIESVDCRGLYLAPGLVDTRVHTGEPGEEHKETLESAGAAAAVGGITSLVLLPDNEPPFDDASLIEFVARRARQIKLVNMYAYGALTNGLEGKELAEIGLLAESGAVAFTDADHPIGNAQVLRRALYYAKAFDALIVHLPQEPTLSGGHMTSGEMATRLGLSGNPPLAEVMLVERDIRLAEMTGGRLHLAKISTAEAVAAIAAAKARGLKITCDTAAPYFALNDLAVGDYRTFGKLVPPLAGREGPAGRGRGPEGRHHRRHRVGPSPAGSGQQARALRPGRAGRHRARDPAADLARAGAQRPSQPAAPVPASGQPRRRACSACPAAAWPRARRPISWCSTPTTPGRSTATNCGARPRTRRSTSARCRAASWRPSSAAAPSIATTAL